MSSIINNKVTEIIEQTNAIDLNENVQMTVPNYLEEWKDVEGFTKHINNNFEVSNYGRARNKITGKILKIYYLEDSLRIHLPLLNGKYKHAYLHDLVALHFIRPIPENVDKYAVSHINSNKHDNHVSNLFWRLKTEINLEIKEKNGNARKVYQYNLDGTFIAEICILKDNPDSKINCEGIRACCNDDLNSHGKYVWKYAEPQESKKTKKDKISEQEKLKQDLDSGEFISMSTINGIDYSNYFINKDDGSRIINKDKLTERKVQIDKEGYHYIKIGKKDLRIHKVMHRLFNGGEYDDCVGHLDKNRSNNKPENIYVIRKAKKD